VKRWAILIVATLAAGAVAVFLLPDAWWGWMIIPLTWVALWFWLFPLEWRDVDDNG
jgi:hypothetical protein